MLTRRRVSVTNRTLNQRAPRFRKLRLGHDSAGAGRAKMCHPLHSLDDSLEMKIFRKIVSQRMRNRKKSSSHTNTKELMMMMNEKWRRRATTKTKTFRPNQSTVMSTSTWSDWWWTANSGHRAAHRHRPKSSYSPRHGWPSSSPKLHSHPAPSFVASKSVPCHRSRFCRSTRRSKR